MPQMNKDSISGASNSTVIPPNSKSKAGGAAEVTKGIDPVVRYMLTKSQREKAQYPTSKPENWCAPVRASPANIRPQDKVLAIDVECVITQLNPSTAPVHSVARVSVVNMDEETLYDELVKPDAEVVDYLTDISGLSASSLLSVTRNWEDVQQELIGNYIFEDTVLVGHALQNDLKHLEIFHKKVIDTQVLFPHPNADNGHASALRYLVAKYLGKSIQGYQYRQHSLEEWTEQSGHSSVIDACASLQLLALYYYYNAHPPDNEEGNVKLKLSEALTHPQQQHHQQQGPPSPHLHHHYHSTLSYGANYPLYPPHWYQPSQPPTAPTTQVGLCVNVYAGYTGCGYQYYGDMYSAYEGSEPIVIAPPYTTNGNHGGNVRKRENKLTINVPPAPVPVMSDQTEFPPLVDTKRD